MTEPLHVQIAAELAKLEAMRRRRGIVTSRVVADALPPYIRNALTPFETKAIADAINAALEDNDPTPVVPDHQTRAAGEG